MDPIGIGTSQTPITVHQMVTFLKGIYVCFNKSWEEDTLQKTEACETGSFQKPSVDMEGFDHCREKSSTQIIQVHSSQNPSKAPHNSFTLKENLWTKISLWKYVECAHHTLCSWVASPLTQKPEGQKSCPSFHLHHPGVQQREKWLKCMVKMSLWIMLTYKM